MGAVRLPATEDRLGVERVEVEQRDEPGDVGQVGGHDRPLGVLEAGLVASAAPSGRIGPARGEEAGHGPHQVDAEIGSASCRARDGPDVYGTGLVVFIKKYNN